MKKMWKRQLSALISAVMLITAIPDPAFAKMEPKDTLKPAEIITTDGKEMEVEDDWETVYPYGVFLFANGQTGLTEGGREETIKLYRLGGTEGRATAYVNYNPAVMQLSENRMSYDSAAGYGDIEIEVEDTLPVAKYQPVGKPAEPEKTDIRLKDDPYTGEDAEEGDRVLTLESEAESWQWYVLSGDEWRIIEDATKAEFVVSANSIEEYDFRCVFTKDNKRFCTESLKGVSYEKEPEEKLPKRPEDLDLNPKQTFTKLTMDPDDPYSGYVFAVTFAEGEWVKEIRIKSPEDSVSEPVKFGTFTLVDHLGADILSAAGTLALTINDNDDPEAFSIDFTEDSVSADKAEGSAKIRLKRYGGKETPVTLEYRTEDGTAEAGKDYRYVSGNAMFFAGIDEAEIEVPLINDGIKSDEPRTFLVRLGELKGDSGNLCTLSRNEIEVRVTNSGGSTAENLVTMLYSDGEEDISGSVTVEDTIAAPVDDRVITGEQTGTAEDGYVSDIIESDDVPILKTYNYGEIGFDGNHGKSKNYWDDYAYIAGSSDNDYTSWDGGSANGNGWQYKSKSPGFCSLKIPYMAQMFEGFSGKFEYNAHLATDMDLFLYEMEYVYGWADIMQDAEPYYAAKTSSNPRHTDDSWPDYSISYTTGGQINYNWNIDSGVTGLRLGLSRYDAHDAKEDVYSRITSGKLRRRTFDNNLGLRIHTANDGESGGGNIRTAPEGAAEFEESSGVYSSMKPDVSIVPGAGGVNSDGRLYVGSKLRVSLQNLDSYRAYTGDKLDAAVYLTRSNGEIVKGTLVEQSNSKDFYVTLLWNGMTAADLMDTYTINIVMTRSQWLLLDLSPSVSRGADARGEPVRAVDTAGFEEAWLNFQKSGSGYITLGYSETTSEAPYFSTHIKEKQLEVSRLRIEEYSDKMVDLRIVENLQYINFNRDPEDRILFNDRIYKGNERIWLATSELSFWKLRFNYYSKAYVDAENTMTTSVMRTELYFDGDGDGKISGNFNRNTGYFELAPGSADRFVMMLDENGSYNEVSFAPELLDNGKYGEYFLKVYYTMLPRSLTVPQDKKNAVAQVLPAFTTSITEQTVYSGLTEEQQSYRYVLPAIGADGIRTSDNHPMYGEKAGAVQFVDVPLGGDRHPLEYEGDKEKGYTFSWEPEYHGNLIYPFTDPDPIYIEHSLAGDNIPLADVSFNNNTVITDEKGKANLNGYLGSFTGDTTIALCVTEQQKTADELKADPESAGTLLPESTELIRRSTVPDTSSLSYLESPGMGDADVDPSDAGSNEYTELMPDFGIDLPFNVNNGLLGYVTILTKDNEVMISVSVPVFSMTGDKKGGDFKKNTFPDTVGVPTEKKWNELKGLGQSMKEGNTSKLQDIWKDNGFKGLKNGDLKSTKITVSVSVTMVYTLKYDKVKNEWYFNEFAAGTVGSLSFKYTKRFATCPIVYIYAMVTVSNTMTTGATVERKIVERAIPFIKEDSPKEIKKGGNIGFSTDCRNINIEFRGKLYVEVLDKKDGKPVKDLNAGFMRSDGGKRGVVNLGGGKGMKFGSAYYIRITALEDTTINYMNVVESDKEEVRWSGVKISPKLQAEFGIGAGVDFAKIEGCFKLVASINIIVAPHTDQKGGGPVMEVQSARIALTITLRAVLFGASWEFDAAGISVSYKNGEWHYSYILAGDESDFQRSSGGSDMEILRAYDSDDPSVPFQLSGFNSSVSSFRLADGMALGHDYDVLTVNGENYLVYTIDRDGTDGDMDRRMLVLSRIVSTGGIGNVGLVNPLDDITPSENSAGHEKEKPYIPVDTMANGSDDGTGDLDFSACVDGSKIRVSWVSYTKTGFDTGNGDAVREASKHTVVKTASYDTSGKDGFTKAVNISGVSDNRVMFSASLSENLVAWVNAVPMTDAERNSAIKNYKSVLASIGYDPDSSGNTDDEKTRSEIGKYRLKTQQTLWDGAGKQNSIVISMNGCFSEQVLPEGQTVDNIVFTGKSTGADSSKYVAAYTTRETVFTDKNGERLNSAERAKNILTIRRLCLTEFYIAGGRPGGTGKCYCVRTLYDYEDNTELKDGIWSGGRIIPCEEPYFANLKSLTAALGDKLDRAEPEKPELLKDVGDTGDTGNKEDFLLFEMNGCTYLIREDDLYAMSSGNEGSVTPFFAVEDDLKGSLESGVTSATGRSEVTIGTDGEGGLAAVYVSTVPNTTNNALFMCKYDPKTGTWGKGTILAMNHMDVYEDSVNENWEPEETGKAFLGERENYGKGGMDQFTFTEPKIALGVKGEADTGESSVGGSGRNTTLLILTQGNYSYLKHVDSKGEDFLTIDPNKRGDYPKGTGLYAISYGVGHQTIGEAALSFINYDFTAGAELRGNLSFKNTGDVGIRGSGDKDQAITVTLSAAGDNLPDTRLLSWTITENIVPGQKVSLDGSFTLPMTLPEGTKFNITVSEGDYYASQGGLPYSATLSGVLTVEEKPELGFEKNVAVSLSGIEGGELKLDKDGNAVIDIDFLVSNRGNADAGNVYAVFSFDTGERGEDGSPVYKALDITDNTINIGEEEKLELLKASAGQTGNDLKNGILYIGSMRRGYRRRISGTITLSPDMYFTAPDNSLGLRVELFSDADTGIAAEGNGLKVTEHGEYNSANNVFTGTVEAVVSFALTDQLMLPKGYTLRLPVNYLSAAGSQTPDIQIAEYPDKEDTEDSEHTRFTRMEQNLDLISYESRSYAKGRGKGDMVVRAGKEGSGYIRIMDRNTNSYRDISYQVTNTRGTSISPKNTRFNFYNRDGSNMKDSPGTDWMYVSDCMRGVKGCSLTFETTAESIDLYVHGSIEVESTFPGFRKKQMKGTLEEFTGVVWPHEASCFVYFGPNPDHRVHKVTVRYYDWARSDKYVYFKSFIEHYGDEETGNITTTPDKAPKIYWAEKFPEKGSINPWVSRTLCLNIVAVNGFSSVTITGSRSTSNWWKDVICYGAAAVEKKSQYWAFVDLYVIGNGDLTIDVVDKKGNHCVQNVKVDWFKDEDSATLKNSGVKAASAAWKNAGAKDVFAADKTGAARIMDGEEIERPSEEELYAQGRWMRAELIRGDNSFIRVKIEDNAPYEEVIVVGGDADTVLDIAESPYDLEMDDMKKLNLKWGGRGSEFDIPVDKDGLQVVTAYCFNPDAIFDDPDSEYAYTITRPDGAENTYDAREEYYFNIEFFDTGDTGESQEKSGETRKPVTQYLPDNVLTFDSVQDGDTLYLLKGGKYFYEEGLNVIPEVKKAVKLVKKKHRLKVKKDSVLTLKKGDAEKKVTLKAVKIKKKNVKLSRSKPNASLSELFTNAEELLPDVKNAQFAVSVKKDKKGILKWDGMPAANGKQFTLSDIPITTTGNSGTATIQATFGGKVFRGKVKFKNSSG